MKTILLHSKTINTLSDGRPCTPYFIQTHFFGFIGHRKGFTHKWYVNTFYTGCGVIHILGFRFVRSVKSF